MLKPRFRAFLIHLAVSAVLGLIALGVVFEIWYPTPLDAAVGVKDIFLLLLGVDVIVGPVLTCLVYSQGKKSLRFDLAIIITLQLAAFFYGMWTVADGRPAWLAFNVDRFDLVQVYEIDTRKLMQAEAQYRTPGWMGPKWVAARVPLDIEKRNDVTFEAIFAGVDIAQRPEQYVPLAEQAEEMQKHAKSLDELKQFNAVERVQSELKPWSEANAYLPMMARIKPMTVLINTESAKVVAVVDLNPWQ